MITKKEFIVPTYYKDFVCKCGDCRTPCCGGWSVTVSMREYFELLSLECSDELRHKINCALTVINGGNENAYARLTPSWLGTCHLQREDGLCAVHAECGEWSLPNICRVYPRCARSGEILRLCCSSSCEKTVELFMENDGFIDFESAELPNDAYVDDGMSLDGFEEQKKYIKILQDRTLSIRERLSELYKFMFGKEPGKTGPSFAPLDAIIEYYKDNSDNVSELCEKYESLQKDGKMDDAIKNLYSLYPKFDLLLEHLLVNNVFYSAFPIGDERISKENAFVALGVIYALTKVFAATAVFDAKGDTKVLLADAISAFYRLCEHSSFAYNSIVLLKRAGIV